MMASIVFLYSIFQLLCSCAESSIPLHSNGRGSLKQTRKMDGRKNTKTAKNAKSYKSAKGTKSSRESATAKNESNQRNEDSSKAQGTRKNPKSTSISPTSRPSRIISAIPSLTMSSIPSVPRLATPSVSSSMHPSTVAHASSQPSLMVPTRLQSSGNPASTPGSSLPTLGPSKSPTIPYSAPPSLPPRVSSTNPSLDPELSEYYVFPSSSPPPSAYPTMRKSEQPSKLHDASVRPSFFPARFPFPLSLHPSFPTDIHASILPTISPSEPSTKSFSATPTLLSSRGSFTDPSSMVMSLNPTISLAPSASPSHSTTKESSKSIRPSIIPKENVFPSQSPSTTKRIEISLSDLILSLSLPTTRRLSTSGEDKILQTLLHSICVQSFSMNNATVYDCNILVNPIANIEEGNKEEYIVTKKVNGSVYFALRQDHQTPDQNQLDERISEVLEGKAFLEALQKSNDHILSLTKKVKVYFSDKNGGASDLKSEPKTSEEFKKAQVQTRRYLSIIIAMTCTFVSIYVYQTKLRPILSSCKSYDYVQSASTISPPVYLEIDEPFDETSILGSIPSHQEIQGASNGSATPNTHNIKKGDTFRETKSHHILQVEDESSSNSITSGTFELLWNEPSVGSALCEI